VPSQVTTYKQAFHPASETGGKIKLEINNTFFNFKNQGQWQFHQFQKNQIQDRLNLEFGKNIAFILERQIVCLLLRYKLLCFSSRHRRHLSSRRSFNL
jgi:hypothetical protein